jgi:hypothetical protein
MSLNPYEPPQKNTSDGDDPKGTGLLVFLCFVFVCLTLTSGAVSVWTANYRLDHTDAFGHRLTPPPIPLETADWVLLWAFIIGCISATCAVVTAVQITRL